MQTPKHSRKQRSLPCTPTPLLNTNVHLQTSTEKQFFLCLFCFCRATRTVQGLCLKLFTHLDGLCWRRKDAAQQRNQQHGARTRPGALGKHCGSLRKQKFMSRIEDLGWMQPEWDSLSFLSWPTCLCFAQEVEICPWIKADADQKLLETLYTDPRKHSSKNLPPCRATQPNYQSPGKKYCWFQYQRRVFAQIQRIIEFIFFAAKSKVSPKAGTRLVWWCHPGKSSEQPLQLSFIQGR